MVDSFSYCAVISPRTSSKPRAWRLRRVVSTRRWRRPDTSPRTPRELSLECEDRKWKVSRDSRLRTWIGRSSGSLLFEISRPLPIGVAIDRLPPGGSGTRGVRGRLPVEAVERYQAPDGLHGPERPGTAQKPVAAREGTAHRKRQNESPVSSLKRVHDHHQGQDGDSVNCEHDLNHTAGGIDQRSELKAPAGPRVGRCSCVTGSGFRLRRRSYSRSRRKSHRCFRLPHTTPWRWSHS